MAAQGSRPLPPQYQHYIPQFILRNFSTRTSLDAGGSSTAHVPSDPRRDRARKNEYVVNHVDLSVENTTVQEKSGRRVFGEENMYDDDTQGHKEQRRVEKKLGKLESDASGLFRHMLKAFSEGQRGFWLYRNERNLIRKFLFVMKYRGPTFYERYHHSTLDTYTAEDKDQLSAYMQEKGFSRPIDVWLYNLETLIDLEMDNKGEWMADLPTRMYAHDAAWAVMHCQMFYMAVCTPSDPAAEFILTDNCFHVHEGPNNISTNWQTGESEVMGWLNLHEFAPVSPRLIIVLRSFLFPSELEDVSDPKAKERRGQLRSKAEALVGCIDTTPLADIPVSKARSNYTLLKANGELQMMPDEDGTLKPEHSFFFRFFSINLAHTNRINGVFLENVGLHTSIVFTTKDSFRHTLEWYLTDHKIFRKRVSASPEDSRRTCLLRLSQLLRYLGSSAKLYMEERAPPVLTDDEIFFMRLAALRELRQSLPSLLKEIPDGSPTEFIEFMSIYQSLGGSISSLPEDMDQVSRMTRLRIKIDVWSQGIDEKLRQANRLYLVGIYRQFPRRRWWLYLKQWRRMTLSECDGINHDALIDAPEDIVAKVWRLLKSDALNNMMYLAVGNHILKRRTPGFEPWATITLDENVLEKFGKFHDFVFHMSIAKCGIVSIEAMATDLTARFRETPLARLLTARSRLLSDNQLSELWVRNVIMGQFGSLCQDILQKDLLNSFKEVFFTVMYPTPPSLETLFRF